VVVVPADAEVDVIGSAENLEDLADTLGLPEVVSVDRDDIARRGAKPLLCVVHGDHLLSDRPIVAAAPPTAIRAVADP
jgi:hypothetical protein